jgi:hypothetical protein
VQYGRIVHGRNTYRAPNRTSYGTNPQQRQDKYGTVSHSAFTLPIPHTTVVLFNLSLGRNRAHTNAYGPPALALRTLDFSIPKKSTTTSTSPGQSFNPLFGAGDDTPYPGRSIATSFAPTARHTLAKLRAVMRKPGRPWKGKIAGAEGRREPYIAKPRVRPSGVVTVWLSSGLRASLDGEGGVDEGRGMEELNILGLWMEGWKVE